MNLIKALYKIIAKEIQSSGNLENKIRELEEELRQEIADVFFKNTDKPEQIFQLALDLGRDIREKTIYGMEVDGYWYYFIGTENEIIQKLEEFIPAEEQLDDEAKEAIEDLDRML